MQNTDLPNRRKSQPLSRPYEKSRQNYYYCNFHSRIDLLCWSWPRKIHNNSNVAQLNSEIIAIIKEPIVGDVHCTPHAERINYMQIYTTILQPIINYVRDNNNKATAPNLHENCPAPNSFIAHQTHNSRTFPYRTR